MPRRNTDRAQDPARHRSQRHKGRRAQRHKDVLHEHGGHRAHDFKCAGCRLDVSLDAPGTGHRNHCPNCLVSLHVDARIPGDRAASCRGRMEAVSMSARPDGEWMLIHQCLSCGELSANRIAGDDNPLALVRLALRPLQGAGTGIAHRALLTL
ncbi:MULTISPECIES: RNHCP domain-containing protein [Streptomyces]|uniref:RNHCP domain-containing protein n=1 Tax=Streptomyces TaxID=1883 RepID=UPI00163CE5EC|nr:MULTISPECIES: RNHCP domain-containing protein [Streptomyces]MBC2873880.1 RNHCP domain-containing protein [Streptomyces sp. TYQ1024]UBI39173.1 RNHCP domain-containing protein [Streptomyces mobaraensis]UKW31755.1 RNHCP domain-containing protein [Streptomyces sp. TYQ1024]